MTDTPNTDSTGTELSGAVGEAGIVGQASAPAQPAAPVQPAVAKATHQDKHNAANTTMTTMVPPASPLLAELSVAEREAGGYLTVFLGNSKKDVLEAQQLIGKWFTFNSFVSMAQEGRVNQSTMNKANADWEQYVAETYPGRTPKEIADHAADLYAYMSEIQDEIKVRSHVCNEAGITNLSDRGGNYVTGDIVGKKPARSTKGFSAAEVMRRSALRSNGDKLIFDVLLRDSFVSLSFTRPNRLEMGDLLNDIRRTIVGYVREINNNSAVLARIASIRVIWNFLATRITSCSVSDISDFRQLANVITLNDMEQFVVALIESLNTKGVNLNLRCLAPSCKWDAFHLVEPSKLVQIRPSLRVPEELAIYANLINGHAKYTIEETLAMSRAATYGLETNRVYNDDKTMCFLIAPPVLTEAFNTFDYFIGRVNPQLFDIRQKVVDPDEYATQITMAHNELGSTEYIHWVTGYINLPTPGTDEEEIIILRKDTDDTEFNEGVMAVILDHPDMNRNLTRFILNKTPYMSRTFIGVQNYVCPVCSKQSGDLQDPEHFLDRKLGYTPIDPIMSFFTLTQLAMLAQAVESGRAKSEALSE
jgi:hypothetical protein